eukprot:gnl/TRDRNA2_/TRDRNA2_177791_c0_seq1.p1 gnl/TRDRNA2_/TRDRNA2_177791_c0~~gnl/TRDRNA2_/TRDRNA2_177791_c0_seq1.p1  ORF type:complete len:615 (+),score=135.92 gnl/TRDRNA2_/TRDRNA2_177791_c0_seq1:112-1956(+)
MFKLPNEMEKDKQNREIKAMPIPKLKDLIIKALQSGNENSIPPMLRRKFARRCWSLIAFQLVVMFIVSCLIDYYLPVQEEQRVGYTVWGIGLLFSFLSLAFLWLVKDEAPMNYVAWLFIILVQGTFWGLSRYVIGYFEEGYNYCLHFIGIAAFSVFISTLCCQCGITESVSVKMMPVYERESRLSSMRQSEGRDSGPPTRMSAASAAGRMSQATGQAAQPTWPVEQKKILGDQDIEGTIRTMERATLVEAKATKSKKAIQAAMLSIKSENDGIMRATILIGALGWAIGWLVDLGVLGILEGTLPSGTKVSMKAAGAAGAMALPLVLFLHLDIVRQMRRHAIDEYMKCVVCVNADMFGFLVGFFVLISIIAVSQADNMEAEEGGGGGGGSKKTQGAGGGDDDEEMGEGRDNKSMASNKRTVQAGGGEGDDDGAGGGEGGTRGTVAGGGGGARAGGGGDDGEGGLSVGGDAEGGGGAPRPFSDAEDRVGWGRTINPNADAANQVGPLDGGMGFNEFGDPLDFSGTQPFWWRAADMVWLPGDKKYTQEDIDADEKARLLREEKQKEWENSAKFAKDLESMQAKLQLKVDDVKEAVKRNRSVFTAAAPQDGQKADNQV